MNTKKPILLLFAGILLMSTLACSVSASSPNPSPENDPTPIVFPIDTSTIVSPTAIPSLIPEVTNTNTPVPTLVPTQVPATQISNSCATSWFFTFNAQHKGLGNYCPAQVKLLTAVGEDFEGGRAYRYAPDPDYPADQRGTIYIIYNDGEWVTYPDTWDASQPSFDPDMSVPADRYQPVDGIGKVWREVPDVRNRLGWAYEQQSAFQGRFQTYSPTSSGDSHYFFIYHGKWGLVLLLNSVDMGPNKWEVAGTYP